MAEFMIKAADSKYFRNEMDCCAPLLMPALSDGKRTILGTSVSLSEAEPHWRDFLKGLQERDLCGVRYVLSDDHDGLKADIEARMFGVVLKWYIRPPV